MRAAYLLLSFRSSGQRREEFIHKARRLAPWTSSVSPGDSPDFYCSTAQETHLEHLGRGVQG